eukprot:gnl/MRDRNA2_/MRDRNA2_108881_c0_seq1.p1 gnl/MRDRNA2_/MRDRNA2_108881_c0~~gnl/MRDRNA2_/MRDRNA2_108881_c0_seq1.p1  ORF type:complete len:359 (-),score=58.79 gnl/MRDRNA2_/MRDRNA2_108881_c0_seq1:19-1095(-)
MWPITQKWTNVGLPLLSDAPSPYNGTLQQRMHPWSSLRYLSLALCLVVSAVTIAYHQAWGSLFCDLRQARSTSLAVSMQPARIWNLMQPVRTHHSFPMGRQVLRASQPGTTQSADAPTSAAIEGGSSNVSAYAPKVSTWGVFPRPPDISKAYGGGRTIRAGEKLESIEAAEKRKKKTKELMSTFRKKAGLDISPEVLERYQELFDEAEETMKRDSWEKAAVLFGEAAGLVPFPSPQFGNAALQRAVCLDSIGRGEEARKAYSALKRHPDITIARTARQLGFGFEAAKFLQVNKMAKIELAPQYEPFFQEFMPRWKRKLTGEVIDDGGKVPLSDLLIALTTLVLPFVLVAGLRAQYGGF